MISKSDNGKTLVILPIETYKTKIQDFIQNPTDQHQKIIKQNLENNISYKHNINGGTET
jgi:hypothetical protein